MTKFSFNPFQRDYHSTYSPDAYKELIIALQRRIRELTTAILQAKQYLEASPGCKPVLYRLNSMARELAKVRGRLARSERNLAELLEKIGKR